MPNQPKTPARAIRIEDALWRRAKVRAGERGETVSDAVRRFLERYAGDRAAMRQQIAETIDQHYDDDVYLPVYTEAGELVSSAAGDAVLALLYESR